MVNSLVHLMLVGLTYDHQSAVSKIRLQWNNWELFKQAGNCSLVGTPVLTCPVMLHVIAHAVWFGVKALRDLCWT